MAPPVGLEPLVNSRTIRLYIMWCILLTVAVPDKIFGLTLFLDFIDRCHSLWSLYPPPAALPSLPCGFHISFCFYDTFTALPRNRVILSGAAAGCVVEESVPMEKTDPSIRLRLTQDDSGSRYLPTIILQITMLLSVNQSRLYC